MITNKNSRPQGNSTDISSVETSADPECIKDVRDFVAGWFRGRGYSSEVVYVARTVASELVTNALLHGSDPGDPIVARVLLSDAGPVIEVEDGSDVRPVVRPMALDALSGRGLAMVELMTRAWGVRPRAGGGKVVYAVLDVG